MCPLRAATLSTTAGTGWGQRAKEGLEDGLESSV